MIHKIRFITFNFRQNGIRTLESGTFDGVPSLSFIDLGRNMLKSVDSSMFKSSVNIRIVDLGKFLNNSNALSPYISVMTY